MKLISRYRSEKPCYYAVFSPTETHTFQTRFYEKFYLYQIIIKIFGYFQTHRLSSRSTWTLIV